MFEQRFLFLVVVNICQQSQQKCTEQLLASLYRILPLIASERVYIADKDMVLLKVLGQLLGLPVPKQISTSELSCLEQRFLTKG